MTVGWSDSKLATHDAVLMGSGGSDHRHCRSNDQQEGTATNDNTCIESSFSRCIAASTRGLIITALTDHIPE